MTGNEIAGVSQCTRLACPGDLESIGELLPVLGGPLYSERFPGKTSAEFCRWKYFDNPAGPAAVGVALDGDRVVSVVAGTPKRVRLGAENVLAFELGDFITAAEYRKRGFFSSLMNLVCDSARQRGAAFVYVRPNEVSFPILMSRLSFSEPAQLDVRRYVVLSEALQRKFGMPAVIFRSLGVDWTLRKLVLPAVAKSIAVGSIDRFDESIDLLWARTQDLYPFSLIRDSKYLNWRYVDCPTPYQRWAARKGDQIVGYLVAVTSRAEPTGMIVDLFTHPEDKEAAAALLRVAIDSMQGERKSVIYTWTLQAGATSAAHQMLKRACSFVDSPGFHMAVRFLTDKVGPHNLPITGWQLAAGDFDGV